MKQSVSALKPSSEKRFLKALDLPDLRELAYLSCDVTQGLKGVCDYRKREGEMITKYGFQVKKA